jgi:hypothetical protein
VASAESQEHGSEWRLGLEPGESAQATPAPPHIEPPRDLGRERLERPLQVVTVEHLGWALIALYALASRALGLGARPLDGAEARHAIAAFNLAGIGPHLPAAVYPGAAGWIDALTAGLFTFAGASDCAVRAIYALAGLLLIAMAFEMRHYIGRAGALGLAAMLVVSPAITWYSRSAAPALVGAAMALVTINLFMALRANPSRRRAAMLGIAGGLTAAADASGLATVAIFILAMVPLGVWDAVAVRNLKLRIQVWLDRYGVHLATVIVAAPAAWAASRLALHNGFALDRLAAAAYSVVSGAGERGFGAGLRFYLPAAALYEFLIVLIGLSGAVIILAFRVRSRFAVWCLLWTAGAIAWSLWTPAREPARIVAMLVPMAVVGAIGFDWLQRMEIWRYVWMPLAIIAAAALYVGVIADFVNGVPNPSEAPWGRHANLFRTDGATLPDVPGIARAVQSGLPVDLATVAYAGPVAPEIRWYLRNLRPLDNVAAASVIAVEDAPAPAASSESRRWNFAYSETWRPDFTDFDTARVMRFLATGEIWGATSQRTATIIRRPVGPAAPTVILTPPG